MKIAQHLSRQLLIAGIVAVAGNLYAQDAKVDPTLATVNGVEIKESQLRVFHPTYSPDQDYDLTEGLLQKAIDNELLYQAAQRQKLDATPEFQKALRKREIAVAERKIEVIALAYQRFVWEQRPPAERNPGGKESVPYQTVIDEWFAGLLERYPVAVNDKQIATEAMLSGGVQSKTDPVWAEVLTAAGIEIGEGAVEVDRVRGQLAKAVLRIGEGAESPLDQLLHVRMMLKDKTGNRLRAAHGFSYQIRIRVIAEAARANGFDKDPALYDYLFRSSQGRYLRDMAKAEETADLGRDLLIAALLKKEGLTNAENFELTRADRRKYAAKYEGRYQAFINEPNGPQMVRNMIESGMKADKLNDMKDAHLLSLREAAKIQVIE